MPSKKDKNLSDNTAAQKKKRHPAIWIFSIIILVLIVITFVVGPAVTGFLPQQSQQEITFGTYDGEPVSYSYNSYFYRQREQIASNWDEEVTDQNYQWQMFQIWRNAFNNTVVFMDLMQRAEKAGLAVTEERLNTYLLNNGPYINSEGNFDKDIYNSTSQAERKEIRERLHDDFIQQQVLSDVINTFRPAAEADFIMNMGKKEKSFNYVSYKLNEYPKDRVIDYAVQNMSLFSQIDLRMLSLNVDENEAESIYAQLESGELSFTDAVSTYSVDTFAAEGGTMGWVYFYELSRDLGSEDAAHEIFSLAPGEISNLVETDYGYAVYQASNSPQPPDLEDDETIADVRNYLVQNERNMIEDYLLTQAETLIETAADSADDDTIDSFIEAAEKSGKTVHETDPAPLNYGSSAFLKSMSEADDAGILAANASNEYVLRSLYALEPGEMTEPLVISDGIAAAVCSDTQEVPDETIERMTAFFPYYLQQVQQRSLSSLILQSDKLEDNFVNVFFSRISPLNSAQ